ncbi:MAG TPA: hypothetical protein VK568_02950 [Thermodesulfobacteriota bacterium]|nr:hypothetical protein [Thermodesulfobacteriota bacterium]
MEDKLDLRLSDFEKEGLYLLFPDSTRLELTKENIERVADRYWQDPTKIPEDKRKAIEFQKCYFCPHKNKEDICDSIRPILPFLDIVDRYVSYDKITAVYKGSEERLVHIRATTMQDALKYVSILSLLRYNLVLQKYWKYYYDIIPIMGGREVATRVYLNMYWLHKGNLEEMKEMLRRFGEELRVSSTNQVKRLNLVCKNDAFVNAFVNTQLVTQFLINMEDILTKSFNDFERSFQVRL